MSHQNRRDPLPEGYQFGDAGKRTDAAKIALVKSLIDNAIEHDPVGMMKALGILDDVLDAPPIEPPLIYTKEDTVNTNFAPYESARPCGCDPGANHVAAQCAKGCINDPRGVTRANPDSAFLVELEKQGIIERVPGLDNGWRQPQEPHNDYSTPPIGDIDLRGGVPTKVHSVSFNCGCSEYTDRYGVRTRTLCADGQCTRLKR